MGGEKGGICFNGLNTPKLKSCTENANLNNWCMFQDFKFLRHIVVVVRQ